MKLFSSYRFLVLFAGLLLFVNAARAQDTETSKLIDSLIAAPSTDDEAEKAEDNEEEYEDETADDMPIDTAITSRIRFIPADTLALIKRDKGYYYQKYLDSLLRAEQSKRKPKKQRKSIDLPNLGGFFSGFTYILWALGIGVLIFVLYKLFLSKQGLFSSNRKNTAPTFERVEEEEVSPDQYESLIKKASAEGNYRLAVRYLYLQCLHQLSDKGYTTIGTEKTNYQYINEIKRRSTTIGSSFSALTLKYEYIWYGEYQITNTAYFLLENDFKELRKQL